MPDKTITERQYDCLVFERRLDRAMAHGKTRKNIAAALGISESSIQKKKAGHTIVRQGEIAALNALVEGK